MRIRRLYICVLVVTLLLLSGMPLNTTAESRRVKIRRVLIPVLTTAPITLPTAWLPRFNAYRSAAGLAPVAESSTLSAGDAAHVNYILLNSSLPLVHSETMSKPGATAQGNLAAQQSNLFSSSPGSTETQAIDAWMENVMHRFGMLRPELNTTGFAIGCSNTICAAALNVLGGLGNSSSSTSVVYPGVNQRGVTTHVFSWQFSPSDPLIVPVGATLRDPRGTSLPLTTVGGVPTSFFNMYAVTPSVALAAGTTYTLNMQVNQNGQLLQRSWSFTTQ